MKKGVGSGSISQRYGSGDPDPHQYVTDPQTDMPESGLGFTPCMQFQQQVLALMIAFEIRNASIFPFGNIVEYCKEPLHNAHEMPAF